MSTALYTPIIEDDRRLDRSEIAIAAGLRTTRGRRVAVTIRNISINGFMAEGGGTMLPGLPVTLDLNGTVLEARIVWKRSGHIGGAFLQPIDRETLTPGKPLKDTAAEHQATDADQNDDDVEIAARAVRRKDAEDQADDGDRDDQPIGPAEKWQERGNREKQRDEADQN
jgi:hypothetical protein